MCLGRVDPDNTRLQFRQDFRQGNFPLLYWRTFDGGKSDIPEISRRTTVRFRPSERGESVPYVDSFFEYSIETRVGRQFGLNSTTDMTLHCVEDS